MVSLPGLVVFDGLLKRCAHTEGFIGLSARDPRIRETLFGSVSLRGLSDQEMTDEVLGLTGDIFPTGIIKVILNFHDLLEQSRSVVCIERRVAAEKDV